MQVTLEGPAAALRAMSAEEVLAFVHLPNAPTRTRYEAAWGPEEGLRVRVVHPGDEEVVVISMEPAVAEVFRP